MGQKVNPLSFRLQTSKAWNSRWFASKKDFAVWLAEDGKIRDLIEKKFSSRPTIAKVEIERSANLVTITIYTAKAGVVIGRGGAGIAELKKEIEKIVSLPIRINVEEVRRPELNAKLVAENKPADVAALSALPLNGSTVDEVRKGLIGKIGENISIRRFQIIEGKGKLSTYIHGGAKIGVIVDVVGGNDEVAHDVAMHIAASKPKALDKDGVDQNLIETERRVAIEKARENGKPEHLIEKIAEGSVNKFLKEVTLLSQPFVKDDSKSVGELLKSNGATVSAFALFVVGEGLEKRNDDFAAEVAAQAAAARA